MRHQELCWSQRDTVWCGGDIRLQQRAGTGELIQSFLSVQQILQKSILLAAAGFSTVNARLSREW